MGNFNNDRRSGGFGGRGFGRSGGGGRGFGGGDRDRVTMHSATCSDCGKSCEVPFRPTGNKPVYCNDCFKRDDGGFEPRRSSGGDRGPWGGNSGRSDFRGKDRDRDRDRQMHEATCSECGEICEVPFKPTNDKPVYCNNCFAASKGDDFKSNKPDKSGEKFEQLNAKLDKILRILEAAHPKKTFIIEKPDNTVTTLGKAADVKKESPVTAKNPAKKKNVGTSHGLSMDEKKVVKKAAKPVAKKKK